MTTTPTVRFADAVAAADLSVAVAESLTCGRLASALGATGGASEWLRGGVVAYTDEVKFEVLGVAPGPVITAECAEQMAAGVMRLLGSDLSLAVTGVGGPGPAEGKPSGTVFIAAILRDRRLVREFHFPGGVDAVLDSTIAAAVDLGLELLAP